MDVMGLRRACMDYYGTAVFAGNPAAMENLSRIEKAGPGELLQLAEEAGIDVRRFGFVEEEYPYQGDVCELKAEFEDVFEDW